MPWPSPKNISRAHRRREVSDFLQLQEHSRFFLLILWNPTPFLGQTLRKFTVAYLVRIALGEDLCQPGISAR